MRLTPPDSQCCSKHSCSRPAAVADTAATFTANAHQTGFTLVEAIIVIVITGVLFAIVGIFIVKPVQGYVAAVNRAELVDSADNAVRLISRELRRSLPNSVGVTADGFNLSFIPTSAGSGYTDLTGSTLNVIGPPITVSAGQSVAFYNFGQGFLGGDAYAANGTALLDATSNRRPINLASGTTLTTTAPTGTIPVTSSAPLPNNGFSPPLHFFVVNQPVTYRCAGNVLTRYENYGFIPVQVNPPTGGTSSIIATNVTTCQFTYSIVNASNGLVTINLAISRTPAGSGSEAVLLYEAVHVDNRP